MNNEFLFPVKEVKRQTQKINVNHFTNGGYSHLVKKFNRNLTTDRRLKQDDNLEVYTYFLGKFKQIKGEIEEQGFRILIDQTSIVLKANDRLGFDYGLQTLNNLLSGSDDDHVFEVEIYDYPSLKKRGLMLDISRGKVFTLEYLTGLVSLLKKLRINVLQLYIEHTFDFKSHPTISEGVSPITKEEILELKRACLEHGIELQANLQSLGHMNHILRNPEYMDLSESDMFWSLDTSSEKSYALLDDLYAEFLPLFDSPCLNICSDEPYDMGKGQSSRLNKSVGELYFNHIQRVYELAAKYDKKIMLFGDVVKHHADFANMMPKDIIYIDWIYDPKEKYGTPKLFEDTKIPYWISPGTSNWNTLFPRLKSSITNIVNLTLEGIEHHAEGMLLTDWNDHGGYTQPAPSYYSYAYASSVAWSGINPGEKSVDQLINTTLNLEGYSDIIHCFSKIYDLVPIWSKNRSQCIMALFDEPITGKSITGPEPHKDLVAYDLDLPKGVDPVFERHSQHPLRPYFSIPISLIDKIEDITNHVQPLVGAMTDSSIKRQFEYILEAFNIVIKKIRLSHEIIAMMNNKSLDIKGFVLLENKITDLINNFMSLEEDYKKVWFEIAKHSEIEISLSYFSNILARYYYLRDWLSIQRENFNDEGVDWDFSTYNNGDYETIPTY